MGLTCIAAFATNNEVLQSATESVTLINSHFAPLSWEITKCDKRTASGFCTDTPFRYYPALESWDPASLRFELQGPRKGILQPSTSYSVACMRSHTAMQPRP